MASPRNEDCGNTQEFGIWEHSGFGIVGITQELGLWEHPGIGNWEHPGIGTVGSPRNWDFGITQELGFWDHTRIGILGLHRSWDFGITQELGFGITQELGIWERWDQALPASSWEFSGSTQEALQGGREVWPSGFFWEFLLCRIFALTGSTQGCSGGVIPAGRNPGSPAWISQSNGNKIPGSWSCSQPCSNESSGDSRDSLKRGDKSRGGNSPKIPSLIRLRTRDVPKSHRDKSWL